MERLAREREREEVLIVHANRGDRIVVEGAQVGQPRREGEVVEVLGTEGDEHYRVRWDNGHETIYFPQSDASVVSAGSGD